MGSLQASEMASMADLDTALLWHLTCNHYPPIPTYMIEPCKQAIEACNAGDYNLEIELPNGVLFRGSPTCKASDVVIGHHLDAWLTEDDD